MYGVSELVVGIVVVREEVLVEVGELDWVEDTPVAEAELV